jgi:hypothetical protein
MGKGAMGKGAFMGKETKKMTVPPLRRKVEPPPKERFEILMEEIRGDVKVTLEGHQVLRSELAGLRQDMTDRFAEVDVKFNALNVKIDGVQTGLKQEIQGVQTGLKQEIQGVQTGLKQEIQGVHEDLAEKIDGVARDLAEHRADTEVHSRKYKVSEG